MYEKKYMCIALEEARKAITEDEVPIGAVLVFPDGSYVSAHNTKEQDCSVLKHAEITAINNASKLRNNWRLEECVLYVTLEPCPMCASAIQQSRISTVYYGTDNSDSKIHNIVETIMECNNSNPKVTMVGGCEKTECSELLKKFFEQKRNC